MVKFKDVICYNPGSGDNIYVADMKRKLIYQMPIKYSEACKLLQLGCEKSVIEFKLLHYFEKKGFLSEYNCEEIEIDKGELK